MTVRMTATQTRCAEQSTATLASAKDAATEDSATPNSEFSVIELRLNPQGHGEGKISPADKAAVDSTGKIIALGNYSGLPVLLTNVTRGTLSKY